MTDHPLTGLAIEYRKLLDGVMASLKAGEITRDQALEIFYKNLTAAPSVFATNIELSNIISGYGTYSHDDYMVFNGLLIDTHLRQIKEHEERQKKLK